ncbi:MAG TPA: hypothetical protein VNO21_06515 [Polyangiaceae bacterium]|nr:hypothetical protein [Polyangiaceae bacterium]
MQEEKLLASHMLVADRVITLLNTKLSRKSSDHVLVETQGHNLIAQGAPDLACACEGVDGPRLDGPHQTTEPRA